MLRTAFVALQSVTFVALGALLIFDHHPRLGAAQFLLATVTGLVYL